MTRGQHMSLLTDVEKLKEAALPEVRETIAAKVSQYFNDGVFDEAEATIAAEILRLLSKDVEIRVRKTLSESLKNNRNLPHDVAVSLANDILEVSLPVVEFSKVLTDDDLVSIIRGTKEVAKLTAISRREDVSDMISAELIKIKNEEVITSLCGNNGARISDPSIEAILQDFKENGGVVKALINRGDLSIAITEKMLNLISGEYRDLLINKYKIDENIAKDISVEGQEKATLGLLSDEDPSAEYHAQEKIDKKVEYVNSSEDAQSKPTTAEEKKLAQTSQLINHLYKEGRLTHSIVLRSLCEGNLTFFEVGISRLAGIPAMNARTLIRDGSPEAFQSLCTKASMPSSTAEAMQLMLDFVLKEEEAGTAGKQGFSQRLVEYIIGNGYDKSTPLMPYLMALIGSNLKTEDIIN